ncbi:hypothetical protein SAMN05444000_12841 [Shimia gijangensis]|uniref:Uncharacterized protein n=1 Tax=Shimia gijangensis TaxID=1470563 RepID=A0A1M6SAW2_9RHOB|nr:hypothetical protein [Shimia gijangensis]SHK41904.1 hypothetical protein SAMN05444000_12841 [Shimia gijangensis]
MILLNALVAALYLAFGNHLWRVIVMRPIDERHLLDVTTKEQLWDEIESHANLLESEKAGTLDHLLVKATFLMTWPVVALGGKVAAMWADRSS